MYANFADDGFEIFFSKDYEDQASKCFGGPSGAIQGPEDAIMWSLCRDTMNLSVSSAVPSSGGQHWASEVQVPGDPTKVFVLLFEVDEHHKKVTLLGIRPKAKA